MKTTYETIWTAYIAITKIDTTAEPGLEALEVSDNFTEPLLKIARKIENQRNALITKYGEKNNQSLVEIKPGFANWIAFEKDLLELLKKEIEIEVMPLSKDIISRAKLSPAEVRSLKPFITKEEEKK